MLVVTLRSLLRPLEAARENAYDALVQTRAVAAQRREAAAVLARAEANAKDADRASG